MADPKSNFPFQSDPYTAAQPPSDYIDRAGRALTNMSQAALQSYMAQPSWLQQAAALKQNQDWRTLRPSDEQIRFAMGMVGPTALTTGAVPGSKAFLQQWVAEHPYPADPAAYAAGGVTATPAPASPASMMAPEPFPAGWSEGMASLKAATTPKVPGPERFAAQLKPFDWRSETSSHHVGTDPETAMHASGAGFNIFKPLFKGGRHEKYPEVIKDPATEKDWERGLFLADNPRVAAEYVKGSGEVLPYLARSEKPHAVDWAQATGNEDYNTFDMHHMVEAGHAKGADMLVIRNIIDIGSKGNPQTQYVVLKPEILRAPNAKFDYSKLKEAMPLAGIAGGAIVLNQNGDLVRFINGRGQEKYDPQQVEGIIKSYQDSKTKKPASDFRYKGGLTEIGG